MSETAKYANIFAEALKFVTEQNDAEKDALREKIDELKVQRKEFDKQIQVHEEFIARIDTDIAIGLQHAAKEAGMSVAIPGSGEAPKKVDRLTPKASDLEIASVLMCIPLEKKHAVKIGAIRERTEFDQKVMEWIMLQLFKAGKIAKVGRGNQMEYYKIGRKLLQG